MSRAVSEQISVSQSGMKCLCALLGCLAERKRDNIAQGKQRPKIRIRTLRPILDQLVEVARKLGRSIGRRARRNCTVVFDIVHG